MAQLGIKRRALGNWTKSGKIGSCKIGRLRRYLQSDVDALLGMTTINTAQAAQPSQYVEQLLAQDRQQRQIEELMGRVAELERRLAAEYQRAA